MGNGKVEEFKFIGDLEGRAKLDDSDIWSKVKIANVSYPPNGKFNLLSLTQLMNKAWLLEGNLDGLKLRKVIRYLTLILRSQHQKEYFSVFKLKGKES